MANYRNSRPSNEPHNAEKLTNELHKCEELQKHMTGVNAYWRKTGTCMGAPGLNDEQAVKLDRKIQTATVSWKRQPYPSSELTNNNSQIKRLRQKLTEVSRGFNGWEFDGGRAEANTEINRLQLFFDEKPDISRHTALRQAGFVFSHANGAYQRQLNDKAIFAARLLDFIKPSDGRTVREHQPKAPVRDTGAR